MSQPTLLAFSHSLNAFVTGVSSPTRFAIFVSNFSARSLERSACSLATDRARFSNAADRPISEEVQNNGKSQIESNQWRRVFHTRAIRILL
jgi:hypothetical protein